MERKKVFQFKMLFTSTLASQASSGEEGEEKDEGKTCDCYSASSRCASSLSHSFQRQHPRNDLLLLRLSPPLSALTEPPGEVT